MEALRAAIANTKFIVVGSGFYGLTLAERISSQLDEQVVVIEKRNHIGGNAHSFIDQITGIEIHRYGSHLFHTSNEEIWSYVNGFSKFNDYRHFVIAKSGSEEFEMPINLASINKIFGKSMTPAEARQAVKEDIKLSASATENNLEDFAISQVGEKIYERLIKGYTTKQWGKPPRDLPRDILQRLPLRFNYNRNYFNDKYMGLPIDGYFTIFQRMTNSANIKIFLDTDFFQIKKMLSDKNFIIYSGPIDQYFEFKHGKLEWRTLDFEFENLEIEDYQGCAVVNYPDLSIPFTRIHEFLHLHPERATEGHTSIAREFSRMATEEDEPYYPINTEQNMDIYRKYRAESKKQSNLMIGGRLGSYKYLDMHMAIGMALRDFERISRGEIYE